MLKNSRDNRSPTGADKPGAAGAQASGARAASAQASPVGRARRVLERGESLIALGGLGTAVVLLAVMGASAWWTLTQQGRTQEAARTEQFKTVGAMLGKAAEGLLASGEVEVLAKMLAGAAQTYGLEKCAVISEPPLVSAAVASGCGRLTEIWSKRWKSSLPYSLAVSICRVRDWKPTPAAGTAIRSFSDRSCSVFTSSRLLNR